MANFRIYPGLFIKPTKFVDSIDPNIKTTLYPTKVYQVLAVHKFTSHLSFVGINGIFPIGKALWEPFYDSLDV